MEFERLFQKNYLFEIYYDDRENEFYELNMGSMTNEEDTNIFLELLRYVPYLKDAKEKIQKFISGLPAAYRDQIEFE